MLALVHLPPPVDRCSQWPFLVLNLSGRVQISDIVQGPFLSSLSVTFPWTVLRSVLSTVLFLPNPLQSTHPSPRDPQHSPAGAELLLEEAAHLGSSCFLGFIPFPSSFQTPRNGTWGSLLSLHCLTPYLQKPTSPGESSLITTILYPREL